jgi:hypothetical protein
VAVLVLIANKPDLYPLNALDDQDRKPLPEASLKSRIPFLPKSNVTLDGV